MRKSSSDLVWRFIESEHSLLSPVYEFTEFQNTFGESLSIEEYCKARIKTKRALELTGGLSPAAVADNSMFWHRIT